MPVRSKKRKTSPLLFLLAACLIVLLPAAILLNQTQPASAPPNVESPSSAKTSRELPPSSEEASAVLPPAENGVSWAEEDFAPIAAIIKAALEEAAAYIPPEESSGSSDRESDQTSSSSLSHFPRPELYGQLVSVYFKDLTSGAEYWYEPDEHYFVASLIKAPYCMYLYRLADAGTCSLEQTITVTQEDLMEGTGVLQKLTPEELPKDYTLRELLSLAIRESDNTAMKALLREFPAEGYLQYAVSLGIAYPEDVRFVTNGRITARDAGVYLNALNTYFAEGTEGAHLLREDMLHTKNAMIRSEAPVVRKYGWASLSFHDMAIVEGEHPYLLAILTDRDVGRAADYALFRELSAAFEALISQKFGPLAP